jgi:hypothetical protein
MMEGATVPYEEWTHTEQQLIHARELMHTLLSHVGRPDNCRGCNAPIYFVRHLNGKFTPYSADGENHFIACPNRDEFKRRNHATTE